MQANLCVSAIVMQLLTYHGFYDSNLEFVGLENVQIVASMTSGSGLGRHKLTTRFSSIVRIASMGFVLGTLFIWLLKNNNPYLFSAFLKVIVKYAHEVV